MNQATPALMIEQVKSILTIVDDAVSKSNKMPKNSITNLWHF
jgi:hypothetical protein